MRKREIKDLTGRVYLSASAVLGIGILVLIFTFIIKESIPAIKEYGLTLLKSPNWYPTSASHPEFGMAAMIAGSLEVTALTTLFVLPLGYVLAFFLYEYANPLEKKVIKSAIDLLSGVPSVLTGMFLLLYISPFFIEFKIYSTENLLLASIGLAILSLPFTASLMEEALSSIDRSMKEGALALGASRFTAGFKVVSRGAFSGIATAAILTVNRIIGETMVVLMVAGGAAIFPESVFDPVRPLTSLIASEMGEVELGSIHYSSLFFAGLILLSISFLLTLLSRVVIKKSKGRV